MELTAEEKERIYQEEKERIAAQKKIKSKGCMTGCLVVVLVIGGLAIIGNIVSSNKHIASSSSAKSAPAASGGLTLMDGWGFKYGQYGNQIIAGRVKNESSKTYSYAQIQFNLYDESHAQIGSAMANVNNLEPGGTWKFEAGVLNENTKTAKFKELTGW